MLEVAQAEETGMADEKKKVDLRSNEIVCENCGRHVAVLDALKLEAETNTWWLECKCGALFPPPKRTHLTGGGRFRALDYHQEEVELAALPPDRYRTINLVVHEDADIPTSVQRVIDTMAKKGYEVAEITFKVKR